MITRESSPDSRTVLGRADGTMGGFPALCVSSGFVELVVMSVAGTQAEGGEGQGQRARFSLSCGSCCRGGGDPNQPSPLHVCLLIPLLGLVRTGVLDLTPEDMPVVLITSHHHGVT
jgi:hypothetical protein